MRRSDWMLFTAVVMFPLGATGYTQCQRHQSWDCGRVEHQEAVRLYTAALKHKGMFIEGIQQGHPPSQYYRGCKDAP